MLVINLTEAENFLLHMVHMVFVLWQGYVVFEERSLSLSITPCNLATPFSAVVFGFARVLYGAWHGVPDD